MKKSTRLLASILAVLLMLSMQVYAKPELPKPVGYANDFAGVLRDETEKNINSLGKQLQDQTGAQVVLVTIDTLGGESIEDYANDLFNTWGIGQKDKDNGILMLYANKERLLRIEVGYGLEGAVTDIKTARIREDNIKPYTKENDFDRGFYSGYNALVQEVAKEYDVRIELPSEPVPARPAPTAYAGPRRTPVRQTRNSSFAPILFILFLGFDGLLFRFKISSTILRMIVLSGFFRGGRGGRGGWGGGSGGFGGGGGGGGFSGGGGRSGGGGSSGRV